ncbi:hypothetical protein QBC37DRAFT_422913 [Rhypophila decipiens]|uniref:Uncharacterized protein n=1 Tax=Rhypophila decipiens TaxID=261697 RepID=A0AAN6YB86_9PEZI|nr:hypothetical protein QBC37DRAFT_422913 [Rhypophila decipiens]
MASKPIIPIWLARLVTLLGFGTALYFGLWGTYINGAQNGLFAAIGKTIGRNSKELYIPGGPAPYTWTYTGVERIDRQLRILVSFFGGFLHGETDVAGRVVSRYLTMQFCAGWFLLSLEGLRGGSRGIMRWTGVMGLIFQNVAYTNTVPIWLALHLFLSRTAKAKTLTPSTIAADPVAAKILPLCVFLGFGIPTIAMGLPSPDVLSAPAHYAWVAIWQLFPVLQSLVLMILRPLFSSRYSTTDSRKALESVYMAILGLAVMSHMTVLIMALVPASAIPNSLAGSLPSGLLERFKEVDLYKAFVPIWPGNPPTIDPASVKVIPTDWMAPLATHFLQWDVYCGNLAVLLWAGFLYYAASYSSSTSSGVSGIVVVKSLGWLVFGGPVAAATYLLWERDDGVYQRELAGGKKVR